jgi:hypothetical protein
MLVLAAILSGCVLFAWAEGPEEEAEPGQSQEGQTIPGVDESIMHEMMGAVLVDPNSPEAQAVLDPNSPLDSNSPLDPNSPEAQAVLDPNSPEAKIAEAWKEFESASNGEGRQLNDPDTDKRFRLARAAKRQSLAELNLIRLVAEQEGATQTVEAIDKMIEMRLVKLDAALDEAKDARRQERMKEREERQRVLEERRKSRRD